MLDPDPRIGISNALSLPVARPGPALDAPGATGFAPIKSIVEDAFARGIRRPMQLYWGAREARDLYALELTERWQRGG